jgi:hypothetical protein
MKLNIESNAINRGKDTTMLSLTTTAHWRKARTDYLTAARQCRDTLTDPAGHWRYAPHDQRVKAAVQKWIDRAKAAHAISMGRQPVIVKAIVVNQGEAVEGSLYAEAV